MSLKTYLIRKIGGRKIANCLTGKVEDLKKLIALQSVPVDNPGLKAFARGMSQDIDADAGFARIFLRLGSQVNPQVKKKIINNLIFNWSVDGAGRRMELLKKELWVPSLVVISPTMRCNLNCTGCYSGLYSKDGELSEAEIDDILVQCRNMGCYFVVITGGEPYTMKHTLLKLFKKHNDMYFLTYTNGTLLDEATVKQLAKLGNVAPGISLEGYAEHTDRRRSEGVYDKVMSAMSLLKKYGVMFGMSVTYTRENVDLITQDEFVEYYIDKGALFAWYFMFMPVGKDPILELVPTPEQRVYCGNRVAELRRKHPLFMADFWNDGPAVGGCLAGARNYLHILNSGRIEPCVFAHFGVDNIREKSIVEAANSPFFKAIRREFPYNEEGNLKRPCMIIDNPQVLRKVVDQYMVPEGHKHSEDLIHDPEVVDWIDEYAEAFRKLVDPVWKQLIEDPQNRWYKEGEEYKDLFRFKTSDAPPIPEWARSKNKEKAGVPGS